MVNAKNKILGVAFVAITPFSKWRPNPQLMVNICKVSQTSQIEFPSYLISALLQISNTKANKTECKQEKDRKLFLCPSKSNVPNDKVCHNTIRQVNDTAIVYIRQVVFLVCDDVRYPLILEIFTK